ncbi:isochorismate synthase DhbC [Actinoplanes cyaneus]|uniref:isochorismate synthase n=1 Tax=Actinoplanes cyaneus TaxID=52696 RepID=A0A919IG17_9ACTN|nr:isochorismate synthase [Actinoplanes cyaneus]MCW2142549.1 isochorismate synthase [Actinoplanes cyaneus]GID65355.1 isochorismate synthase DhbC [Actinoplanes cyaneus]
MTAVSTDTATTGAAELLAGYQPGESSLFASPRGTLLAEGTYFAVPPSGRADGHADLARRVGAVLGVAEAAGHEVRTVVGAVPFAPGADARLIVPQRLRRGGAPVAVPGRPSPFGIGALRPVPTPGGYRDAVARAVAEIRDGRYTKVVLARSLHAEVSGFDPAPVVRALTGRDPGGYTFAVDLGAGRTLFGASPELLVARHGRTVTANPLAGSAARSADPVEDRRRAAELLASAKDRHEHAVVSEQVAEVLRRYCSSLDAPAEPSLVATATMWHLSTLITGEIADPAVSALELATALHPTPAVCGTPTPAAREAIGRLEPFDRGFYTGMVGWVDAAGDGEWAVTIRCATAGPSGIDLYAGAGVVADSDPSAELAETTAKLGTLLSALGVENADVA